jgi:hypothetical protein
MALNKQQLQKRGPKGHKLAHITPLEGVILEALGGSGKVNPQTKIKQYDKEVEPSTSTSNNTGGGPQQQDDDNDDFEPGGDGGIAIDQGPTDPGPGESTTSIDEDPLGIDGGQVDSGSDGSFNFSDYSWNPFDDDYEFNFNNMLDTLNISSGSDEGSSLHFQGPGFEDETAAEYHARMTGEGSVSEQGDASGSTGNVQGENTYADWEGNLHDTQAGADTANEELLATGKAGAIEGAEGFEHDLSGGYKSAYEQQLSDAYDAAYAGIGQNILNTGTGDYGALEDAVPGQGDYLTELSTNYQKNAQNTYDDWYGTNTDAINALTNLKDIEDYVWTDMPEYDLDNSGGYAPNGTWEGDLMPEFYGDFNKVYAKDYKNPSGWQYDADGNPIPGSFGPTEGISSGGAPPDGIEEPESTAEQEAEGLGYTNPYQAPTGVQQYSPAKGSASYRR